MFSRKMRGFAFALVLGVFILPTNKCWKLFSFTSTKSTITFSKCQKTNDTMDCFQKNIQSIEKGSFIDSSISKVDLRLNNLQNLTKGQLDGGERLKILMLSFNNIKFIGPSTFSEFEHLRILYLDHNELHKLDYSVLEGLSKLKALYIGHNSIVSIDPKSFHDTKELVTLSLENNPLLTFKFSHSFLDNLPRLLSLDLSAIGLVTIPDTMFKNLTKLQSLMLNNNNMTAVPTRALNMLPKLISLDISANPMKSIESRAFKGLSNLKTLTMSNMPFMEKIREGVFDGLINLESLYCSYNYKLFIVHRWAFTGTHPVRRMRTVILKSNKLAMLHEDTLPWQDIFKLDLSNNPWSCDCDIAWMTSLRVPKEIAPSFKCSKPPNMAGKMITRTKALDFVCHDSNSFSSMIAIVFISAILIIISITVVVVMIYRLKTCVKLKAAYQKEYKVFSNKNVVEITVDGEDLGNRVGVLYGTKEIELNNSDDEENCYDARDPRRNESSA